MLTAVSLGKRQSCSPMGPGYTLQHCAHPSLTSNEFPSPCFSLLGWDTRSQLASADRSLLVSSPAGRPRALGVKPKGVLTSPPGWKQAAHVCLPGRCKWTCSPKLTRTGGGHFSKYRRKEICEWILKQQEVVGCLVFCAGLCQEEQSCPLWVQLQGFYRWLSSHPVCSLSLYYTVARW